MELLANSTNDLNYIADRLLEFAKDHRFLIFNGEMGAGKTTFIKAFCKALGVSDNITSPTFSIINEYLGKDHSIFHFDFYRLKNLQEAFDLGYEDYFYSGNYCLVEWPERVTPLLPDQFISIDIVVMDDQTRKFIFTVAD